MKILYISPNGYLGGAERCVCNIAEGHLKSQKINFEILFFSDGDAAQLCRDIGAKVHILPIKFKMRNIFKVLKVCKYIRAHIKIEKFDLVHSTMPYAHIIAFLSTLCLNIKRVWFQHGPVGGVLDTIANNTSVDRIYFNSLYLEKEHLKMTRSKRNQNKHLMINYGILESIYDKEVTSKIRETYSVGSKFIFLSAGRLCPWKGQLELIKAIVSLRKTTPEILDKICFLVIGSYGRLEDKAYEDEIKNQIKKNKLEESIIMLGHKNNIIDYYNASDVFLHTSLIPEPFGLVVAESMKNDCLVIGSDKGGVTDILIDQKTGYSFDSTSKNSEIELARIISKVWKALENDSSKIKEIKASASQLINMSYSVEQMTQSLEEDYVNILK